MANSSTQENVLQATGHAHTTSETGIKYRTTNNGQPLAHADVDNNFEILRKAINGLVADIDAVAKVDIPAGAVFTDTIYTLPTATGSVLGGVKIGNGITISNGVIAGPTFAYNSSTKTLTINNA